MLQFLNLFKIPFVKSDIHQAETIYKSLESSPAIWTMVEVNSIKDGKPSLFKSLDAQTINEKLNFRVQLFDNKNHHEIWKNNRIFFSCSNKTNHNLDQLFNHLIDQIITNEIKNFQGVLDQSIKLLPENNSEEPSEDKALEWIKVSFIVLEKAIVESFTKDELLFIIKMYIGINPRTNLHEMRILLFNLDITFTLSEKGLLDIVIFDDKNEQSFSSSVPALRATMLKRSRECLDQLTKFYP